METDENKKIGSIHSIDDTQDLTTATPVNSLILNYYKKFGRKRDLEQYFSLSTAQSDIQDTNSYFWRQMKSQNDSSDSGERKSGSSNELCRISIKCSVQEPSTSQDDHPARNSDTDSPPIITENSNNPEKQSDNESFKSDDNHSQKSHNETLDTSMNKPLSPTSSVTSQRKLEWDSLADVGYGNESDRKTSGSSLSTLERLALKQQYSNNDTKCDMGFPTAHSTPFVPTDKPKSKRHTGKSTKIYRKDIDVVEVNVPQDSRQSLPQAFNVNLTKNISFNLDKSGEVCFNNPKTNTAPTRASVETEMTPLLKLDRESQTSLLKTKETQHNKGDAPCACERIPALPLSLKTLRRYRKKKIVRKKAKAKPKTNVNKKNSQTKPKTIEQVSEAESFEYMPGHIYNQNQLRQGQQKPNNSNPVGNKSSLESSAGALTTDSSKGSKPSFTKDLDKSIKLLQHTLQGHSDYSNIKKKLIKEVVERLLQSKYRDDESSTDFLSGLSYSSQKLGIGKSNHTTSSTSDAHTDGDFKKPRKSILRVDKFNPNVIASTSQSAPNLPIATSSDPPILPNLIKPKLLSITTTDTEDSSKEKLSTDTVFAKTSSDELYKQYLQALRRENEYKKHLKDKEKFLKQKLVGSDLVLNPELRIQNRIKDLMKDLTRNNYDDGSGDASKLEGGPTSYTNPQCNNAIRKQRNHSVFTLSSGHSDKNSNNNNLRKKLRNEICNSACSSNNDNRGCKCVSRGINHKIDVSDSSVQVNLQTHDKQSINIDKLKISNLQSKQLEPITDSAKNIAHIVSDDQTGDIKYVCVCPSQTDKKNEQLLIYKCSRLDSDYSKTSAIEQKDDSGNECPSFVCQPSTSKVNKDSEDDCRLILLQEKSSESSAASMPEDLNPDLFCSNTCYSVNIPNTNVTEATRCLQTEISINPKIPEAQLSDVVFLDDCECAMVISEADRISQRLGEHNIVVSNSLTDTCKWYDNNPKLKEYERFSKVKEKVIMGLPKIEEQDNISTKSSVKNPDNFTIPISGTNVSLMVSISKANETKMCSKDISTQKTPQAEICDKGTCLSEECSKGVQSENSQLFAQINQLPSYCTGLSSDASKLQSFQSKCSSTCCKFNTHPKMTQLCDKKPFLRSNTDPGNIINTQSSVYSVCTCGSYKDTNKIFVKKDVETQLGCTGVATQKSETVLTTPLESQRQVPENLNKTNPLMDNYETPKTSNVINTQTDILDQSTDDRNSNKKPRDTDSARSTCTDDTDELLKLRLAEIQKQIITSSSSSNNEIKTKKNRSSTLIKKKDPLLGMIKDITKRYSKEKFDKTKKVKCFKEFISVLNYLVNTDDSAEAPESTSTTLASPKKSKSSKSSIIINKADKSIQLSSRTDKEEEPDIELPLLSSEASHKIQKLVDKAVQLSARKYTNKGVSAKTSEEITSTDLPYTSSDSATCEVLNKIKKECEKYQQKRCKSSHHNRESSSSSCDCKRSHHCPCKSHKGHKHKTSQEKAKKTCIAYNLILQTSDSMVSEEIPDKKHALKNIVVKVPKRKNMVNVPFQEVVNKFEKKLSPDGEMAAPNRPGFVPNTHDNTSSDEFNRQYQYTVRDYLESNRPDFVENTEQRQNCLKIISERRANECATKRQLLSMQLEPRQVLSELNENELRSLAKQLGVNLRSKKDKPKFMSEKEMKKHSQKIYKSLPEVVKKKNDKKKENIKKTNLLMADIFKKNLQKKTLTGNVNISNYSCLVKI